MKKGNLVWTRSKANRLFSLVSFLFFNIFEKLITSVSLAVLQFADRFAKVTVNVRLRR